MLKTGKYKFIYNYFKSFPLQNPTLGVLVAGGEGVTS
jgi:hypothetical protein